MGKIDEMNQEIESKIKPEMGDEELSLVKLKYKDIVLNIYIYNLKGEDGYIDINELMRGHFILDGNLKLRIFTAPRPSDPPSEKGDGALFLSLMVINCNSIFGSVPYWKGDLNEWWKRDGNICSIENACTSLENDETAISNDKFLEWAKDIVYKHQEMETSLAGAGLKYKSRKRKLNKRKSPKKKKSSKKKPKKSSKKHRKTKMAKTKGHVR